MVCGLYCSPTQAKYVANIKRDKKDEITDVR